MEPKNITITKKENTLIINQRWFDKKHKLALFMGFATIVPMSFEFWNNEPLSEYIVLIFCAVGLVIYGFVGFINHSLIIISPTTLMVICKPIACFNKVILKCDSIAQLFVTYSNRENPDDVAKYTLQALDTAGNITELISGVSEFSQVQYLEAYIENFLDIEDIHISSEYKGGIKQKKLLQAQYAAFSELSYLKPKRQHLNPQAMGIYKGYTVFIDVLPKMTTGITLTKPKANNLKPKQLSITEIKKLFSPFNGRLVIDNNGQSVKYEAEKFISDKKTLEILFERLKLLLDHYDNIIYTGAEAVAVLHPISQQEDHIFQATAIQLLENISHQTTAHFKANLQEWLCSNCLNHYIAHKIPIKKGNKLTYYACKGCGKSYTAHKRPKQIVLILDNTITQKWFQTDNILYINWLNHKTIFDFDTIKIKNATDEDIERLAIQVGNDTDPTRQNRYKQLPCTIDPTCTLSENSLKLLNRSFQIKN